MRGSPLKKLLAGDYGLARTFWLFGMLTFVTLNILLIVAMSYALWLTVFVLVIFDTLYRVCVWVGIWRASRRYRGATIWALLARLIVVLVVISNVLHVLTLWDLPSENFFSTLDGVSV